MKMLENIKIIYANTNSNLIVVNPDFLVLWTSNENLPMNILLSDFENDLALPILNETVLKHRSGSAVKITPIFDQDKIDGYLLDLYDIKDIEILSCRSDRILFQNNFLGNIRLELSEIISTLDQMKLTYENNEDFQMIDHKARYHILRTFSTTVNTNAISDFFSDEISTQHINLSEVIENTLEWVIPKFENNMCKIVTNIQPLLYMDINYKYFEIALLNLISNAYMYSNSEQKVIKISLRANDENSHIVFNISDNGTNADTEKIKGFISSHPSFPNYTNHEGLGLIIVNLMSKNSNGQLEIKASETGGLSLTIDFENKSNGIPKIFKLRRFAPMISQFDIQNCILAKAIDPIS